MTKLVTIFGGSGFVGRYIARRLAKLGWRVRVAARNPHAAGFVRTYGSVGQVEPILANIRDDGSVAAALDGANAVVNCVGILAPFGKNTFDAVQTEGAARIASLSARAEIPTCVHISAIGADPESESDYARTKGEGETRVQQHMPRTVILRPSIIFGPEDEFFNRFASLSRFGRSYRLWERTPGSSRSMWMMWRRPLQTPWKATLLRASMSWADRTSIRSES